LVGQLALALALVAVSSLLRWSLWTAPGIALFATYFPAILVAGFAGGWLAAIVATPASLAAANLLFIAPSEDVGGDRGGSVCLNACLGSARWISASVMLRPGLAAAC
jgi:hypothetical protein